MTAPAQSQPTARPRFRCDETEWFWVIVDGNGLADVPSDEVAALQLLCRRAEAYDALVAALRLALPIVVEYERDTGGHATQAGDAARAALKKATGGER